MKFKTSFLYYVSMGHSTILCISSKWKKKRIIHTKECFKTPQIKLEKSSSVWISLANCLFFNQFEFCSHLCCNHCHILNQNNIWTTTCWFEQMHSWMPLFLFVCFFFAHESNAAAVITHFRSEGKLECCKLGNEHDRCTCLILQHVHVK